MPDFPHLSDTDFPHLGTVDPYRRRVDFDYSRYDYEATAKLCRVTWPQDYRHVVNWKSANARDAYFENIDGETVELSQGFVRTQTDRIRVPVPYDVALTYNYVYMRVPQLTEGEAIDYETPAGVRIVCAFIVDAAYMAPNTTELILSVDTWTTYLPHLSVASLMLERGHAPMHGLSVADYLADPVATCAPLLTPDVDFGGGGIVRGGGYVPLATGALCYVLALTIPYASMSSLGSAGSVTTSPATFSDIDARDGYQRQVNGYVWGFNGRDYRQATQPSAPAAASGDVPTGLYYYAIATSGAPAALASLLSSYPQIATACQALYVVPEALVTLGTSYTLAGITLRAVSGNPSWQEAGSVDLTPELFGYPTKYAGIAKLYTMPYAHIEVADDLGQSVRVAVEDTHGSVDVLQRLSMAWPALDWQATVDAQSTAGAVTYAWARLDGSTQQRTIPGADLAALAIDYGIPAYSLYLAASQEWALESAGSNETARARALFAYDSTARNANTARENAIDSNSTANANALASNATANTNALASNATANTNALASNATANTNALASNDTAQRNATRSAENVEANATNARTTNTSSTNASNASADTHVTLQATAAVGQANYDTEFVRASYNIQNEAAALTNITSTLSAGAHTAMAAVPEFTSADGSIESGIMSLAGGAVDMVSAQLAYQVGIAKEANLAALNMAAISNKLDISTRLLSDSTIERNRLNDELTGISNNLILLTATNNANTAKANANLTKSTSDANANRTKDTGDANANRTKATGDANANRTKDTGDANANRSKATADANATYSRNEAITIAQNALELARTADAKAAYEDAQHRPPVPHGAYSDQGSMLHEAYRNRGMHVRIVTESASAIARAGDAMLRYGYRYDGLWTVTTWCPADRDYSYWQSSDVQASARDVPNPSAWRDLMAILAAGTTVWNNPDRIGQVMA